MAEVLRVSSSPLLARKFIFQTVFTKMYLESRAEVSTESTCEDNKPRSLHKVLSSGQNLNKIFFSHSLNTLCSPKHESVCIKRRDQLDIEIVVGLFVETKEPFGCNGAHALITT